MHRLTPAVLLAILLAAAAPDAAAAATRRPATTPAKPSAGEWPDTRVGALARRWTEAFGKGEPAIRACLAEILAPEALAARGLDARIESYRASFERLGGLMLVSVDSSGAGAIKARLAAADFSTHVFTFQAQVKPPYKLLQVSRIETRHHGGHGH